MKSLVAALTLTIATAISSLAPESTGTFDALLLSSARPHTLRVRLDAFAAGTSDSAAGSLARYFQGLSFERGAEPDSAILSYRRAVALSATPKARDALVDALLRRRAEGDIAEAIQVLGKPVVGEAEGSSQSDETRARLGWARVLAGDARQGVAILGPLEVRLSGDPDWRYRLGRSFLEAGDVDHALPYLTDLQIRARAQDPEIATLLAGIERSATQPLKLKEHIEQSIKKYDSDEQEFLDRFGGRRVRLRASDHALIGGVLVADSTRKSRRSALILGDLGDPITDFDSLCVALCSHGMTVFYLDPRGWGWSVAPEYSLPDTWHGREQALEDRVASDVSDAIAALGRLARVDTARVLAIGVGSMSPVLLTAAAHDHRIAAVALLDPRTSPVERGAALAHVRVRRLPTYVQLGLRGHDDRAFADTLAHSGARGASQLAGVFSPRSGAAAFGSRPDVTPRFVRWLDQAFPARVPVRSPRRPAPR